MIIGAVYKKVEFYGEMRKDMGNDRFEFGKNWKKYLDNLSDKQIKEAQRSLQQWFGLKNLEGKSFLDIGSGSGLFSLAARNLGARVFSFDYDENSVGCTKYLKNKFYKGDRQWQVEQGDILDKEYLSKFEKYDIVYSWGVLHHTGHMYQALQNASDLVADNGTLFIAIYNDQGSISKMWKVIKKTYNDVPGVCKGFISVPFFVFFWGARAVKDILKGTPFLTWKTYVKKRGMSPWTDAVDWVGGYPFEVAKPEEIFDFFHKRGYTLEKMMTKRGGNGCNQFVFARRNKA